MVLPLWFFVVYFIFFCFLFFKPHTVNIQMYFHVPKLYAETRGPRAFYRSPDNQQQTVQSEKKDNQNERIQINACVVGNTSVCCCEPLV